MSSYIITTIIIAFVYWAIGVILVQVDEDYACYWAMGLLYPILWIILYPIRTWKTYSSHYNYYQKHGITRLQYMFGKRVNNIKEGDDNG